MVKASYRIKRLFRLMVPVHFGKGTWQQAGDMVVAVES